MASVKIYKVSYKKSNEYFSVTVLAPGPEQALQDFWRWAKKKYWILPDFISVSEETEVDIFYRTRPKKVKKKK